MMIEFVRVANAKKKFKIKDSFEFIEFNDITDEGITEDSPVPDQVEIWAAIKISYTGTVPERYRTLNYIIGDWVEEHEDELTDVINEELKKHFEENYPNSDASELHKDSETLWLDQLDFMPQISADSKTMIIEIELVLDTEAC